MAILDGIRYFTRERGIMQSLCVTAGDRSSSIWAMDGSLEREKQRPVDENTLYDLASLTKFFTGLTVMCLREEGKLDLQQPVTAYDPRFRFLTDVTVDQLLGFEVDLKTPGRVDSCPDREAGLRCLMDIQAAPQGNNRFYSDMHALVLGCMLEEMTQQPLLDLFRRYILTSLDMQETFAKIPGERLADTVCYGGEHRIEGERYVYREGPAVGIPHDPKAALLSAGEDRVCGHAGLFSTRQDMTRFCQGVLAEKILPRKVLAEMSRNRLGRQLPDGSWTQYLGSQCYVKHPNQYFSEIPVYMGEKAMGLSGFTGNHMAIDPERGRFSLFLGNRVLDRLTVLLPTAGKQRTDYGLAADGSGSILWRDGSRVLSSVDYVHQKDEKLHREIALTMGWDK